MGKKKQVIFVIKIELKFTPNLWTTLVENQQIRYVEKRLVETREEYNVHIQDK